MRSRSPFPERGAVVAVGRFGAIGFWDLALQAYIGMLEFEDATPLLAWSSTPGKRRVRTAVFGRFCQRAKYHYCLVQLGGTENRKI